MGRRKPLRIAVVGEDPLARGGIASLLGGEEDLRVVGSQAPGEPTTADVVVWDLGADPALWQGAFSESAAPTVALVASEDQAAQALASGARAVLPRDAGGGRLAAAARAARDGLVAMDPAIAAALFARRPAPAAAPAEALTPREREVLDLLARGLSNKEIGAALGISEHTAKFHVNAILEKLGAAGRTEAVVRAARLGWVTL
jgi:DNA-binding NarL/FixJ family response regulator